MPDVGDLRRQAHLPTHSVAHDVVLDELGAELFASLPRSDQRRKGIDYMRGLLGAPGRKSIRNIAALIGGQATEQSLHHFISDSTWDWAPVRRALTQYVMTSAAPQAFVVRSMVIPKAGNHSVGVDRRFCPSLGQSLNAQQAVGVWAASEEVSAPVNWRLHLSQAWLTDSRRRTQASIPDGVGLETLGDCTIEAYLEMAARQELPRRPVVLDAREMDAAPIVRKLRTAAVPFLVRVSGAVRLIAADPALPGHSTEALPAHQIMGAARGMRRPVSWVEHGPLSAGRTSLAGGVRVRMPVQPGEAGLGELLLLGAGKIGQGWPSELWLTDMIGAQAGMLLRLSRLTERADRDLREIADQVGIRDFAGRSFSGWHRHVTLASAAHAVAALTATGRRQMSNVS